ncbi:MAG: hypothetical protein AAFQ94_10165 [Bacteroidota bacterium]
MKGKILALFLFILIFSACSQDDPEIDGNESGLIENQSISIQGENRQYHLFIPSGVENSSLLFLLHGNGSSYNDLTGLNNVKSPYKPWLDIAEDENIILVIPNGNIGSSNRRGWNDCRSDAPTNPNSADVLFISSLIDFIIDTYQADSGKVYALGTSNGGHLCIRLAEEIPDKLTAFGAILASNAINSQCLRSNVPISALFMNGTSDPILPYEGGEMAFDRGEVLSTEASVNYWIDKNNTNAVPQISSFDDIDVNDNSTVEKHLYLNGTDNTEVVLYKVIGGGHTEPSIEERYNSIFLSLTGNQNGDIEMANEVWAFFKNKSR